MVTSANSTGRGRFDRVCGLVDADRGGKTRNGSGVELMCSSIEEASQVFTRLRAVAAKFCHQPLDVFSFRRPPRFHHLDVDGFEELLTGAFLVGDALDFFSLLSQLRNGLFRLKKARRLLVLAKGVE